jgi:hypothetical protein
LTSNEHHQIIPFQLDKIEYMIKSQQEIIIKVRFCPFQTGNYQCKINIKCQFCPQHQPPSSTSLITLVGVCYDPRNEVNTFFSKILLMILVEKNHVSLLFRIQFYFHQ